MSEQKTSPRKKLSPKRNSGESFFDPPFESPDVAGLTFGDKICRSAFDSLVFAGLKYSAHFAIGGKWFMTVDPTDIGALFASDILYYFVVRGYSEAYVGARFEIIRNNPFLNEAIFKSASLALGVTIIDLVVGDKHRLLSNLIAIGLLIPANWVGMEVTKRIS